MPRVEGTHWGVARLHMSIDGDFNARWHVTNLVELGLWPLRGVRLRCLGRGPVQCQTPLDEPCADGEDQGVAIKALTALSCFICGAVQPFLDERLNISEASRSCWYVDLEWVSGSASAVDQGQLPTFALRLNNIQLVASQATSARQVEARIALPPFCCATTSAGLAGVGGSNRPRLMQLSESTKHRLGLSHRLSVALYLPKIIVLIVEVAIAPSKWSQIKSMLPLPNRDLCSCFRFHQEEIVFCDDGGRPLIKTYQDVSLAL